MARFLETFPTFKYDVSFVALCLHELVFSYARVCVCAHEHMGACRSTRMHARACADMGVR